MTDILLAGPDGERFGGLETALRESGERFGRASMDLTDPKFMTSLKDPVPSLLVARFHEGDLASIKAMQTLRIKHPCVQFIFITGKEISAPVLTLMFNEGAFGVLKEPLSADSAVLLARQAIKKSKWDLEEMAKNRELGQINQALQIRVDHLETAQSRSKELTDKLERLLTRVLSDKLFKPARIKVLLAMSSEYQRNLLMDDAQKAGFTVQGCKDAAEALDVAKRFKPAIVVADLELEGKSGVELAQAIKGDPAYPNVHFVVVTSTVEKIDAVLAPGGKVDDCVLKPTSPAGHYQLMARIALGALHL